jgi:hypothetical protein
VDLHDGLKQEYPPAPFGKASGVQS